MFYKKNKILRLAGSVFTKIQVKSGKKKKFRYFIENSSENSNNTYMWLEGYVVGTSGQGNNITGGKS